MSVDIILTRNVHWVWSDGSAGCHRGSYARMLDPVLVEWFTTQQLKCRPQIAVLWNNHKKNKTRSKKVIYFRFNDLKTARNFVLSWGIDPLCVRMEPDLAWKKIIADSDLPKCTKRIDFHSALYRLHKKVNVPLLVDE